MRTLAVPFSEWATSNKGAEVDALVIGSGYGASVAAKHLTSMGRSVVVLERGSEYLPGDFPNEFGQMPKFQRIEGPSGPIGRATGLFNWRIGSGFASLVANGLGGGSLINAGVVMEPDSQVFALPQWPAAIRHGHDSDSSLGMRAAFVAARKGLRSSTFQHGTPAEHGLSDLPKSQALGRLGDVLLNEKRVKKDVRSIHPADVTIDLSKCISCGDCFTGCNQPGAKLTLRETYLGNAFDTGAVIVTGALVWTISPLADDKWQLRCLETHRSTYRASVQDAVDIDGIDIRARYVVVAAGTFGSTELLQRSKHRNGAAFRISPTLGSRLSGNGDSLSASVDESEPVDGLGFGSLLAKRPPPVGPTITSVLDLRDRSNLMERLVIEEGAVPGALVSMYQEILATTWTLNQIGSRWRTPNVNAGTDPLLASRPLAAHSQLLLTMGHDSSAGNILYMPAMDASVPYWVRPEDEATYKHQEFVLGLASQLGGMHLPSPLWRTLPPRAVQALGQPLAPAMALTVHPLGGCPMGEHFDTGVVDHIGHVFRADGETYPTLLVLDGSIVPTSLGCNPILTITALAERAMAHERRGLVAARPATPGPRKLVPVDRSPVPVVRAEAPTFDVSLSERLRATSFSLGGSLSRGLGTSHAQVSLTVRMRSADWSSVWTSGTHELKDIRGRLSLTNADSSKRVDYTIRSGSITLIEPVKAPFFGFAATTQALLTWFFIRGLRDWRHKRDDGSLPFWETVVNFGPLWKMLSQAGTDRRTVRYLLELERGSQNADEDPPRRLSLMAVKTIRYSATWAQLFSHGWARFVMRRAIYPGDLRATYLEQLTEPVVELCEGEKSIFSRFFSIAPLGRGRLRLDLRSALRKSPASLHAGGDSTAAVLALGSYPALVLRHALRTRIFDFRLPDYSGASLHEPTDVESLTLRASQAGTSNPVVPQAYVVNVRRGRSSADDGSESKENLRLPLWRYGTRNACGEMEAPAFQQDKWHDIPIARAKSVLLMHAFGMSGSTFTTHGPSINLAEYLARKGYEVWVFDTRMSTRVSGSGIQGTLDQVGLIDAPAVVEKILSILREYPSAPKLPLQIFSFAHCLGSGAMLVGTLGGRLSYPERAQGGKGPSLPKLAALVCSQVHPFMVGSESSLSKTWVAPLARDVLRRAHVPLSVRSPVLSAIDQMIDRYFASLPVPAGERCPGEGVTARRYDDDCATCRRIRYLDAELFKHRNLNEKTHKLLPALFGPANVRMFAHASKFVDYERLVTEDGLNAYVTDEAIAQYLAFPVRFVHGELNELFNIESASRSAEQYARIHPQLSSAYASASTGRAHHIIKGYGHLDPLIGDKLDQPQPAGPSVFEQLVELIDIVWSGATTSSTVACTAAPERSAISDARFPGLGPWMSPATRDAKGRMSVRFAFALDDLTENSAPAGRSVLASALVHTATHTYVMPLRIAESPAPIVARDGFLLPPDLRRRRRRTEFPATVRVAHGRIPIPPQGLALRVELVTHFDPARLSSPPYSREHQERRVAAFRDAADKHGPLDERTSVSLDPKALKFAIQVARNRALTSILRNSGPYPPSLSTLQASPLRPANRWLHVRAGILDRKSLFDEVRVVAGCCRYPGFPFDSSRSDEAFARVMALVRGHSASRPHAALMLGDQIYADASAHVADPLSAVERFHRRHVSALSTPAMRRLLAALPVVMSPDDHEYTDDYPIAGPLFSGDSTRKRYAALREAALKRAAQDATQAFQYSTYGPKARDYGCFEFNLGEVRFLVVDTRSNRQRLGTGHVRMLNRLQRAFVHDWVSRSTHRSLQFVCTGSVVFPSTLTGADPANPGLSDSWSSAPRERSWLVSLLSQMVPRRFVLLSGDYHLNFGARIVRNGQNVGLALVAPPFYAPLPYANANPADLCLDEIRTWGVNIFKLGEPSAPQSGSGFGLIRVQRVAPLDKTPTWDVTLETDVDSADTGGWTSLRKVGSWRL